MGTRGMSGLQQRVREIPSEQGEKGQGKRVSSGFRGVALYRRTKRWESYIWYCHPSAKRGKQYHLGNFETEVEAARAYDLALLFSKGKGCKRTNFPAEEYSNSPFLKHMLNKRTTFPCFVAALKQHVAPKRKCVHTNDTNTPTTMVRSNRKQTDQDCYGTPFVHSSNHPPPPAAAAAVHPPVPFHEYGCLTPFHDTSCTFMKFTYTDEQSQQNELNNESTADDVLMVHPAGGPMEMCIDDLCLSWLT